MQYTADELNDVLEWLHNLEEDALTAIIDKIADENPHLLGYVMSDDALMLGENEAEVILFIAVVFYKTVERKLGQVEAISEEAIDQLQDANWQLFEDAENKKPAEMAEYVNELVEKHAEPEFLYYILDALEEEESDEDDLGIEESAKVPMFVMLKTVADALLD
ncbi:MAG: hypothetical protein RI894_692 [Bacteroidota bacterium]|jgi:hypothetical protein